MSPALAGWASANPSAALAWFEGLDLDNDPRLDPVLKDRKIPVAALRHGLMRGLVQGLADADPDTATRFVTGLASTDQRQAEGFMHIVAGAVLRTGSPTDAATWAEALPEGQLRNSVIGRVAHQYAESNPDEAAEWAANYSERPEGAQRRALPGQDQDDTGFDSQQTRVLELAAAQPFQVAVDAFFPAVEGREAFHGGAFTTFLVQQRQRVCVRRARRPSTRR